MGRRMIAIISLALIGAAVTTAYCDEEKFTDEDLRVFDGKVVSVDVGKAIVTVKGSMQMDFHLSNDTKVTQNTPGSVSDITLSDIGIGDYITVQYYRKGTDSRLPAKVLAVTVEYKAKNIEQGVVE